MRTAVADDDNSNDRGDDKINNVPGSDEALDAGCTCPVLDNTHGKGYMELGFFVIAADCPLHA